MTLSESGRLELDPPQRPPGWRDVVFGWLAPALGDLIPVCVAIPVFVLCLVGRSLWRLAFKEHRSEAAL